jgi:hypothetical protein
MSPIFLEVGLRLRSFLLRDVGQLCSGPVDYEAAELVVEVDGAVEIEIGQVSSL